MVRPRRGPSGESRRKRTWICGDASRMAKDVETALLDVIAKGSNGTLDHANEYLAEMKKQKRYQRDVY